jgi:Outer membrane lipoprotein-sorting protein
MNRLGIALLALLCACTTAFGADNDYKALLAKVDALVSFMDGDFSAEYRIEQNKPGSGASVMDAVIFRRDREEKFLILITAPEVDKGKGYLKIGPSMWLYDPKSRRFEFTSSKDHFQNSNARNADFTRSNFAGDYEVLSASREKLGKFDCTVLDLKATGEGVAYPRSKIWVSDDNLVRKTEDYSLSGQLMRTTAVPTYQKVGERYVPVMMLIVDNLRGKNVNGKFLNETTKITIAKPSLSGLPDSMYSQAYLEKVSK